MPLCQLVCSAFLPTTVGCTSGLCSADACLNADGCITSNTNKGKTGRQGRLPDRQGSTDRDLLIDPTRHASMIHATIEISTEKLILGQVFTTKFHCVECTVKFVLIRALIANSYGCLISFLLVCFW